MLVASGCSCWRGRLVRGTTAREAYCVVTGLGSRASRGHARNRVGYTYFVWVRSTPDHRTARSASNALLYQATQVTISPSPTPAAPMAAPPPGSQLRSTRLYTARQRRARAARGPAVETREYGFIRLCIENYREGVSDTRFSPNRNKQYPI